MTKIKKQSIMIHKINNGYIIGVVKKEESKRLFNSDEYCKELYIAKDLNEIIDRLKLIVPQLVMMDNISIDNEGEEDE